MEPGGYRDGRGWQPARLAAIAGSESAVEAAPKPDLATFEHPALRGVPRHLPGGLQTAYFPRFWKLSPATGRRARPCWAGSTNGEPFLVEKPTGRGRAILAAVPMDNSWRTNLPVLPDFVRLVHELSYDLPAQGRSCKYSRGAPNLPAAVEEPPGPVRIIRPDDSSEVLPVTAWPVRFEGARLPGGYKLHDGNRANALLRRATDRAKATHPARYRGSRDAEPVVRHDRLCFQSGGTSRSARPRPGAARVLRPAVRSR